MTAVRPASDPPVTTHESPPPSWRSADAARPVALTIAHSADETAVGRAIPIGDGLLVVGRDVTGAGLTLRDPQLSRTHFRIGTDARAGGHRIGDAQSRNGTLVDGARVDAALLARNSVIRAGESVFVYGDPDPLAPVLERMSRVARSEMAVLVVGETGTGKERLAHAVHEQSGRSGPFVAVNCGAMVREIIASELFGHARGAFSGAATARAGLFRTADGGTLFLDEIGDLPLELQPMLLRTLQEGTIRPLGTDGEVRVDVRVVAATHVQLEQAVRDGRFRADLHARLARAVVELPPLRERRSTVLSLARTIATAAGHSRFGLTANAAEALVRYDWPYNVRELESLVQTFLAEHGDSPLDLEYLETHHAAMCREFRKNGATARESLPAPEAGSQRAVLQALLGEHEGNVSAVATAMGKPRSHVYRWLKNWGIDPSRFRAKG